MNERRMPTDLEVVAQKISKLIEEEYGIKGKIYKSVEYSGRFKVEFFGDTKFNVGNAKAIRGVTVEVRYGRGAVPYMSNWHEIPQESE